MRVSLFYLSPVLCASTNLEDVALKGQGLQSSLDLRSSRLRVNVRQDVLVGDSRVSPGSHCEDEW